MQTSSICSKSPFQSSKALYFLILPMSQSYIQNKFHFLFIKYLWFRFYKSIFPHNIQKGELHISNSSWDMKNSLKSDDLKKFRCLGSAFCALIEPPISSTNDKIIIVVFIISFGTSNQWLKDIKIH